MSSIAINDLEKVNGAFVHVKSVEVSYPVL